MYKRCCTCKAEKPVEAFSTDRTKPDGYRLNCKVCQRAANRKSYDKLKPLHHGYYIAKNYGVTEEWYRQTLEEQGGVCAICGKGPNGRHLAVDHDHSTQKPRSLLCSHCNTGIGGFRDDPALLLAAVEYLKRHAG